MTRPERVAELIKEEVSAIIRKDVSDPRIGFISITRVDVSPDMENARIYVSVMGDNANKEESMRGLNSARGFIRGKLGKLLEMRLVPQIRFTRDDSLEKGSNVLGIISKLESESSEGHRKRPKKSAKKR